ncbi:MAG: hypothetical protein AB1502_03915, partial [Thermodesulfobacteriota bacterium]
MREWLILSKTSLLMIASFLIFTEIAIADKCNPPGDMLHSYWELQEGDKEIKEGEIIKKDGPTITSFDASGSLIGEPRSFGCKVESVKLFISLVLPHGTSRLPYETRIWWEDERHNIWTEEDINWFISDGGKYFATLSVTFVPYAEEGPSYSEWKRRERTKTFYIDLYPPNLSINSPADGTVVKAGTGGFQIDVTSNDDVGTKDFTIKVDGIVRDTINAREDKPTLRQWLRAMVFGSGRRVITVVAKDKVDRTDERSFTVYS